MDYWDITSEAVKRYNLMGVSNDNKQIGRIYVETDEYLRYRGQLVPDNGLEGVISFDSEKVLRK